MNWELKRRNKAATRRARKLQSRQTRSKGVGSSQTSKAAQEGWSIKASRHQGKKQAYRGREGSQILIFNVSVDHSNKSRFYSKWIGNQEGF